MAAFTVTVVRTAYASLDIAVDADNEEQAKAKALDDAGNHLFSEHASEYSVEWVAKAEGRSE